MSETLESEAPANPRDDLRSSIESAISAVDTPAPEAEAPDTETDEQAAQRARDERGRFAKQEAAQTEEAAPEGKAPEAPEAAPVVEAPKVEAPPTWSAADKEMFGKAPADVQAFLLKRHTEMEADYTRKTTQVAALRRDFEPVARLFEPHRAAMQEKGFTPASLIAGYVQTEGALMNPQTAARTAADIVKGYKIDPMALMRELGVQMPSAAPQQPQAFADDGTPIPSQQIQIPPELLNLINGIDAKVQTWEQKQAQQQQREAQEYQRQMQQAEQRVMTEIERFKTEVGPDGKPLRPYFAELEYDMAAHAEVVRKNGGDTPPLNELYETAVWANPVTRARVQAEQTAAQEAQRAAQEAKRQTEARAKAAKAQRASSSVTGAPGTGHAEERATGDLNLRDQIRLAREELMN